MKMSFAASATISLAVLGLASLAACSPGAPATDGATPAAAATAAAAAPASTIQGPAAGKWKLTTTMMGQATPATEICYEKQMSFEELEKERQKQQQQTNVTCSELTYTQEGDAQVGHSVCTADILGKPMKMITDTRATGDFKTRYVVETSVKLDPPPMPGMEEQKMQITAERLGDCDPK